MRRRTEIAALLLLGFAILLIGCADKTERQAAKEGWDLGELHEAPVQVFAVTSYGADQGSRRIEIQHQMYKDREVVVQREHSKGIVSGMTETVFDAVTFEPLYQQSYEDSAGRYREDRLEYNKGEVRLTRTESFFGDESKVSTCVVPEGVFDEHQLLALIRASDLTPGNELSWKLYSRKRGRVGDVAVKVGEPKENGQIEVSGKLYGEPIVVTLAGTTGYPVLEVKQSDGFSLTSIEQP